MYIIVWTYVIWLFDCRTMSYDFTDITDASQTHRFQYAHKAVGSKLGCRHPEM